jgi:protein-glutamine gamma-glutamyltransferase
MKLLEAIDAARYTPRLWWLMLATGAARFTTERPGTQLIDSWPVWLVVLVACVPVRSMAARGPNGAARTQHVATGVVVLGVALTVVRLLASQDWRPASFMLLLSVMAGTFIATTQRLHVWVILLTSWLLLLLSATQTHSPWFLPCAACCTFLTLSLLAMEQRNQRQATAALEPAVITEHPGGGLMFAALSLLLAIPVYLFVPKPGNWLPENATNAPEYRETTAPAQPPSLPDPVPEPMLPEPEPQQLPAVESEPPAAPVAEISQPTSRIARPERGDYGEDFGINDIERRSTFANSVMLYVRSSHAVNLRGRVYDRFADNRWSRTPAEPQRLQLDARSLLLVGQPAGPTRVTQAVEVSLDLDATLLHAPGLQRLRFPASSLLVHSDGVLVADAPLRADTLYSAESRLALRDGRYLLLEPAPLGFAVYLQLDGASLRLRELANRLSENASGTVAKALALEQHLRTSYAYSYETIAQQNYTPLDWFLFESRRGHCEFFASALAMMLRAVGIPSRVATGFTLGDPNPITGFHEVRALDGHAWVEAFIEGQGWLMLEPTPFYPLPQPEVERRVASQMDGYLERLAYTRVQLDPGTLNTQLTVLTRNTWRSMRIAQRAVTNTLSALGWMLPVAVIASVIGLMALYLLALAAWDWLDNQQIRRALATLPVHDERTATLLLGAILLKMTTPRSSARRPDWTLREYSLQLPPAAAIPEDFIEAFEAARYGAGDCDAGGSIAKTTRLALERLRGDPLPRLYATVTRLQRAANRLLAQVEDALKDIYSVAHRLAAIRPWK